MYRKLIIVLILIAALLLGAVPMYASTGYTVEDYLEENNFPACSYISDLDWNDYDCFLFYTGKYTICLVYDTNFDLFCCDSEAGLLRNFGFNTNGYYGSSWWYYLENGETEWKCNSTVSGVVSKDGVFNHSTFEIPYYATSNVYSNEECIDVFFQKAPMEGHPAVVEELVLGTLITHPMMEPVMTEILGLIPLVIGLVIFYLGLRKAYQFLVQNLRKA